MLVLTNVLHVPDLVANLISVLQLVRSGLSIPFTGGESPLFFGSAAYAWYGTQLVLSAKQVYALYILEQHVTDDQTSMSSLAVDTALLWHRCLGQKGFCSIRDMQLQRLLHGCDIHPSAFMEADKIPCKPCIQAKMHKAAHTVRIKT